MHHLTPAITSMIFYTTSIDNKHTYSIKKRKRLGYTPAQRRNRRRTIQRKKARDAKNRQLHMISELYWFYQNLPSGLLHIIYIYFPEAKSFFQNVDYFYFIRELSTTPTIIISLIKSYLSFMCRCCKKMYDIKEFSKTAQKRIRKGKKTCCTFCGSNRSCQKHRNAANAGYCVHPDAPCQNR